MGMSMSVQRVDVCGAPVDCVDRTRAIEHAGRLLSRGRPSAIFAMNPEKVVQCGKNRELGAVLRSAGLLIPDGIGVVLAARLLHRERIARVPGCELMPALCAYAAANGHSVFMFGGAPGVAEAAAAALARVNPTLQIAGWQHGYVDAEANARLIERINALRPDILFVALGSPRQELWIGENLQRLDVKLCQAVGGTFDILAGNVKRAPSVFRVMQLEWLYRLLSQPKRAMRQSALPIFAGRALRAYAARSFRRRRRPPSSNTAESKWHE
jgi:N-acetylglucosaminyldiphosphoundecaprenol N-acetyl-beta-D-mannosaminyltransferase